MGVVISILKILGIILLVILAVLVLVLLAALFVPVRYRAKGEVPAEGNPHGMVRVTWLLHLISFRLEYDSGKYENSFHWDFKILGIPFRLKQRAVVPKKKSETAEEKEETEGKEKAGGKEKPEVSAQAREEEPKVSGQKQPDKADAVPVREPRIEQAKDSGGQEKEKADDKHDAFGENAGGNGKTAFFTRIRNKIRTLFDILKNSFQNIRYTMTRLCDKIKRILDDLEYYRDILSREDSLLVLGKVRGQTGRLLRHALPQKTNVNFIVGTGDPATTAQILAIHGILYPVIGETVHISPDFEKIRLEGDFDIRGRVRIAVVLDVVLRMILDKKTWRFIRQLKKEEMTNGR